MQGEMGRGMEGEKEEESVLWMKYWVAFSLVYSMDAAASASVHFCVRSVGCKDERTSLCCM